MNTELIRSLSIEAMSGAMNIDAHDADSVMRDVDKMYIPDCYRDRLAKLIIQECLDIIGHGMDHTDFELGAASMAELQAQRWCRDAIKERFGIE
jgi:hypothetical protein